MNSLINIDFQHKRESKEGSLFSPKIIEAIATIQVPK